MNPEDYLLGLVSELRKLPAETGWVEFKENNAKPEDIGEYLSALSNSAALAGKTNAYMVWGIKDDTHEVVGTSFKPSQNKKGNEELESWLLRQLNPHLHFVFHELDYEGKPVVILEIPRATGKPVQFAGEELIRVGSYRKRLKDHPQIERELWRLFDATPFEELKAAQHLGAQQVLDLLDYKGYFQLLEAPLPSGQAKILARLAEEEMVVQGEAGGWDITNLGAILLANNLNAFRGLRRKGIRVILYEGRNRLKAVSEPQLSKGYAVGFEEFVALSNPSSETIENGRRKYMPLFPPLAVRELVANALIHQDFSVTGSGPMVEVFQDRIEVTNPGLPLMDTQRFIDTAPRSRNEALASFMRRAGICEERGSGVDKIVSQTEEFQLPAPIFETPEGSTRAVLFTHKALTEMEQTDRVRACYFHACLRYVERDQMTNSSLRERFGIEERNSATVSRIIREALEAGMIKPFDPEQGRKYAKYLPFWA